MSHERNCTVGEREIVTNHVSTTRRNIYVLIGEDWVMQLLELTPAFNGSAKDCGAPSDVHSIMPTRDVTC